MSQTEMAVIQSLDLPEGMLRADLLYEVIDGVEVIKPDMGVYEGSIASTLTWKMSEFAVKSELGRVVMEVMFRLDLSKRTLRRPDVAFVSYDRWARDRKLPPGNGWDVVPDLMIEIVSPTDLAVEVVDKSEEYLAAGARLVWAIYPDSRLVMAFDNAGGCQVIRSDGALAAQSVLPGFRLPLAELFQDGVDR